MDVELQALQDSGSDCYINNCFAGGLAYADDLILLSASLRWLQKLLNVCSDVACLFDIVFNVTILFAGFVGNRLSNCNLRLELQGRQIRWCKVIKYLGFEFKLSSCMKADMSSRTRKFQCAVYSLLRQNVTGFEFMYVELTRKKCMPILFYGLGAFDENSCNVVSITHVWNMAFRFIFGLAIYDSTRQVLQARKTISLKFLLEERMLLFCDSLRHSDNMPLFNIWNWIYRCPSSKYNSFAV